jgi:hypothetical protein
MTIRTGMMMIKMMNIQLTMKMMMMKMKMRMMKMMKMRMMKMTMRMIKKLTMMIHGYFINAKLSMAHLFVKIENLGKQYI